MNWQNAYNGMYINYTQIEELYPDKFSLAPRFHTFYPGNTGSMSNCDYPDMPLITGNIYFIDMEREEEIQAGTSIWPYPDLKEGECVLTRDFLDGKDSIWGSKVYPTNSNLTEGDKIAYYADYYFLWHAAGYNYNELVRSPDDPVQSISQWNSWGNDCTIIECTIKGFIDAYDG